MRFSSMCPFIESGIFFMLKTFIFGKEIDCAVSAYGLNVMRKIFC